MFLRTIQKKIARQCRKTARLLKEGKLAAPKGGTHNYNIAFDDKGNPVNAVGLVLARAGFKFKLKHTTTTGIALFKVLKNKVLTDALRMAEKKINLAGYYNTKNVRRAVIKPLIALGEALDNANLRKPYTRTAKPVTTAMTKTAANSTSAFFAQTPTQPPTQAQA